MQTNSVGFPLPCASPVHCFPRALCWCPEVRVGNSSFPGLSGGVCVRASKSLKRLDNGSRGEYFEISVSFVFQPGRIPRVVPSAVCLYLPVLRLWAGRILLNWCRYFTLAPSLTTKRRWNDFRFTRSLPTSQFLCLVCLVLLFCFGFSLCCLLSA